MKKYILTTCATLLMGTQLWAQHFDASGIEKAPIRWGLTYDWNINEMLIEHNKEGLYNSYNVGRGSNGAGGSFGAFVETESFESYLKTSYFKSVIFTADYKVMKNWWVGAYFGRGSYNMSLSSWRDDSGESYFNNFYYYQNEDPTITQARVGFNYRNIFVERIKVTAGLWSGLISASSASAQSNEYTNTNMKIKIEETYNWGTNFAYGARLGLELIPRLEKRGNTPLTIFFNCNLYGFTSKNMTRTRVVKEWIESNTVYNETRKYSDWNRSNFGSEVEFGFKWYLKYRAN